MIDLETFIKSLKICWIKRMIESEDNGILKSIYLLWRKIIIRM